MAAEYIHVKIGLVDAVYPVLEFITTGSFKDFYHFRTSPTTTAWTHKQWCTPCTADGTPISAAPNGNVPCHGLQAVDDSTTTDWRAFLKTHWDTEHNHCQVEHLDEFYDIFRRAAANYINSIQIKHEQEIKQQCILQGNYQHGAHEPRRTNEVHDTSGRQRHSASMSTRDTKEVRTEAVAAPRHKPVELSLFPDL